MKNEEERVSIQNTKMDQNIKLSPFGHLFGLFASWFGFTGLYAMFAICPFCGQQGCPVGMASAGRDCWSVFCAVYSRLETAFFIY